eukprot:NODE_600_length_5523_cov_0.389749.p1 type:complete len:672 gc:universal NODE_600_length_5523_cov_0.389749:5038-3023(-)
MDEIVVHQLRVPLIVGVDLWERKKPQDIMITISNSHNFEKVSKSDDIHHTLDYTKLQKQIANIDTEFDDVESLVDFLSQFGGEIVVELPKGALFTGSIKLEKKMNEYIYSIRALQVETIVGVNPHERLSLQPILIHLEMKSGPTKVNYRLICKEVRNRAKIASFKTIEALNIHLLQAVFDCHLFRQVKITIDKPLAFGFANSARVISTRQLDWYKEIRPSHDSPNIVFLSLGSNINARENIHKALDFLQSECSLLDSSFLYESLPMYKTDQPNFLNCVVKINTSLAPKNLLKYLKSIETNMGRFEKYIVNGPRPIDIDIIYYNDLIFESEDLIIPHRGIQEREFVLQPMNDIAPHFVHPVIKRSQEKLLQLLLQSSKSTCNRVVPINNKTWNFDKTRIMGILNVTPDSFSDGNEYASPDLAQSRILEMKNQGADIIDIGGQSTRPGAVEVTENEELDRVIPVLKNVNDVIVSVDTYRSKVAEQAILHGASMINDVTAGRDPNMFSVIRKYKVPFVMMHMRGTPETMTKLTNYSHTVNDVQHELSKKVRMALQQGIPRWLIIVDPGLGFAKNIEQNIDLIKLKATCDDPSDFSHSELPYCKNLFKTFPVLMGPSRKSFIGNMVGEPVAKDRVMGAAAVVTVCIENGCKFVRVHDVKEMGQVVKAADYIYNRK